MQTARMIGEPIGPQHRDELLVILGDPRVGATLGGVASAAVVDDQLTRMAAHWERHGFGLYAWRDRATGELVARGGPQHVHVGGGDEVEIGWTVTPGRWGEGFATELGVASVAHAFGPLTLPDVVSFTLPDNVASRRVMEKLGFTYERDIVHAALPHVLYRLASTASARSTSSSVV